MSLKRVVITGMALCSAFGNNLDLFWESLWQGKSGIRAVCQFKVKNNKAGMLYNYEQSPGTHDDVFTRCYRNILNTVKNAIKDSRCGYLPPKRTGLLLGSFLGEVGAMVINKINTDNPKPSEVHFNNLTNKIAQALNIHENHLTIANACSAGSTAIGLGADLIRLGRLDTAIAGGYEFLGDYTFYGMNAIGAVGNKITPFDKNRGGTVLGEGVAILILESEEHALLRNARIYASISGYSLTTDAYHLLRPRPDGNGAEKAMKSALENSGLVPEEIDFVSAHGTGTILNDSMEAKAIQKVFGSYSKEIPVYSLKSSLGHTLGASGVFGVIQSVLSIQNGYIPYIIESEEADFEEKLNFVFKNGIKSEVKNVLSNSFGFGGNNASIVITKYKQNGRDCRKRFSQKAIYDQNSMFKFQLNVNISEKVILQKEIDSFISSLDVCKETFREADNGCSQRAYEICVVLKNPVFYKKMADNFYYSLTKNIRYASPLGFKYAYPAVSLGLLSIKHTLTGHNITLMEEESDDTLLNCLLDHNKLKALFLIKMKLSNNGNIIGNIKLKTKTENIN